MILHTDITTFIGEIKSLSKEICKIRDKCENFERRFKITDRQILIIISFLQKYHNLLSFVDPAKDNVDDVSRLITRLIILDLSLDSVRLPLTQIREAIEEKYADIDVNDIIKFLPNYNIGELLLLDFALPLKSENIKKQLKSQLRKNLGDFAQKNLIPELNNEKDQSSSFSIVKFNFNELYNFIIKIAYINCCIQNQIGRKYFDKENNVTLSFACLNVDYKDQYIPLSICIDMYRHIKVYLINNATELTFSMILNGVKLKKTNIIQVNGGYQLLFGYFIHQLGDKLIKARDRRSDWFNFVLKQTSVNLEYIKKKVYEYTGRHTDRFNISDKMKKKCDEIDNLILECIQKHLTE